MTDMSLLVVFQIREGHEWTENRDGLGPTLEKGKSNICDCANAKQKWTYNCAWCISLLHQFISADERYVSRT